MSASMSAEYPHRGGRDPPARPDGRSAERIRLGGKVAHQRGVVAEARAPPIVGVGARNGAQPAHEDVVEPPSTPILGEPPARLSLTVAVHAPEGVDPAVVTRQGVD